MVNKKSIYLGNYDTEEFAAFAFNYGFSLFNNNKYIILNTVDISNSDKDEIILRIDKLIK